MGRSPQVGDRIELSSHVVGENVGQVVVLDVRREISVDLDALREGQKYN